jgi:hypothetical protein
MKKIGILTFHNAYNYGAVLQAYALKKVIGNNGEIINYSNNYFKTLEFFLKKNNDIKRKILKVMFYRKFKERIDKFHLFQQLLVDNKPLIEDNELYKLNDTYDLFVTGSDQVWNLQCSGYKTAYFLDFVQQAKKKNSYAASFGSDHISKDNIQIIQKSLKDFQNISVRETSAKSIVEKLTGREVPVVLDPTLLLTNENWDELLYNFKIKNKEKNKYILLYTVLNGDKIADYARKISKKTGLKLYCITSSLRPQYGMKCIRNAGPLEWLSMVKNAEIIITNSYHGLAFSLIYNKQFYIELLPPPSQSNARILDLLEDLKLTDRIINDKNNLNDNTFSYKNINDVIEKKRQDSLNFLKETINDYN